MKALRPVLIAGAMAGAAAFALPALAQQTESHHLHAAAPAAKADKADMTEGEVRKVDKENKKITLKHGAIKNLDMPAMTMVFQADDVSLLDKVKVGDKVRFIAANPGGKLSVTEIQPVQ